MFLFFVSLKTVLLSFCFVFNNKKKIKFCFEIKATNVCLKLWRQARGIWLKIIFANSFAAYLNLKAFDQRKKNLIWQQIYFFPYKMHENCSFKCLAIVYFYFRFKIVSTWCQIRLTEFHKKKNKLKLHKKANSLNTKNTLKIINRQYFLYVSFLISN